MSPQTLVQVQPLQRQPWDQAADARAVPDAPAAEGGLHQAPQSSPEGHAGAAAGQVSAAAAGTDPPEPPGRVPAPAVGTRSGASRRGLVLLRTRGSQRCSSSWGSCPGTGVTALQRPCRLVGIRCCCPSRELQIRVSRRPRVPPAVAALSPAPPAKVPAAGFSEFQRQRVANPHLLLSGLGTSSPACQLPRARPGLPPVTAQPSGTPGSASPRGEG